MRVKLDSITKVTAFTKTRTIEVATFINSQI